MNWKPLQLSTWQEWRKDLAWTWWVGNGVGTPWLQIDPLLSESDSEPKRQSKRDQRKGQSCTRPGETDHRSATSCHSAALTGAKVARILEAEDQTWPCLRWNNLSAFLRLAFCIRLLQWENSRPTKQQGSDSKKWSVRSLTLLNWSSSKTRSIHSLLSSSCLVTSVQCRARHWVNKLLMTTTQYCKPCSLKNFY